MKEFLFALSLLLTTTAASASERVQKITEFQDWSVFKDEHNGKVLCWVATIPTAGTPWMDRHEPYVLFTAIDHEFSIALAKGTFKTTIGRLKVGVNYYPMLFRGSNGWMKSRALDDAISGAFLEHRTAGMNVGKEGFSFSLLGFEQAYDAAEKLCQGD